MGKTSVIEGIKYEKKIHRILCKCYILHRIFNTQSVNSLGGCSNKADIICNYKNNFDVPIEIKKSKSPECMQCKLNYVDNKWIPSEKSNLNFTELIVENLHKKNIKLFNNRITPFIYRKLTFNEWRNIRNNTTDFNNMYIPIPNDTIKKLYSSRGCKYIQIYKKGLYHLGDDYCNFGVPELVCDQKLRIRIKNHGTKNKKGFCNLSVTAACHFVDIKQLPDSKYSLDDIEKLPESLRYNN